MLYVSLLKPDGNECSLFSQITTKTYVASTNIHFREGTDLMYKRVFSSIDAGII